MKKCLVKQKLKVLSLLVTYTGNGDLTQGERHTLLLIPTKL